MIPEYSLNPKVVIKVKVESIFIDKTNRWNQNRIKLNFISSQDIDLHEYNFTEQNFNVGKWSEGLNNGDILDLQFTMRKKNKLNTQYKILSHPKKI